MATIDTELLNLSLIKRWTPLKDIVGNLEPEKFLDPHYYSINDYIYIQASRFYKNDFSNTINAPFATAVLYTGGYGSVSRIVHADIENDDNLYISNPNSLWPKDYKFTYKGAINFFKDEDLSTIESASYRIATDGAFIFKSIENKKYKLFFRSSHIEDLEVPFAVLYKLKEI
jgi:hypothetical protein